MPCKLNVLSIEKKSEIIKFTEKNSTKLKKDIAVPFSILPNTLSTILKNKVEQSILNKPLYFTNARLKKQLFLKVRNVLVANSAKKKGFTIIYCKYDWNK